MAGRKPNRRTQEQAFRDTVTPYTNPDTGIPVGSLGPIDTSKLRGNQRSVKDEKTSPLTIGIKDIDETISYYFNNVLKPTVVQNGKKLNVPIVYGSPEIWNSVQKDGYFRDRNGKLQSPVIVFKRQSIEKNRSIGNKLDGNYPHNFNIFEKKYSKQNAYDRFDIINNRIPLKEYYAVAIPDYVNITYSCVIITDFTDQNNKIIEEINFASDSYWGDQSRFKFQAMIDSYDTAVEVTQGKDRVIKTNFTIKLLGYIVTDTVGDHVQNIKKKFSNSSLKFGLETTSNLETVDKVSVEERAKTLSDQFISSVVPSDYKNLLIWSSSIDNRFNTFESEISSSIVTTTERIVSESLVDLEIDWSIINNIPEGIISSSTQINEYGIYGIFTPTGSYYSTTNDLKVTGSFDITLDGNKDEVRITVVDEEKLKINDEGILILISQSNTPTPAEGGIYYSSDGNYYLGI